MIVREDENNFIFIEQDHHAHIAAQLFMPWKDIFLSEDPQKTNVMQAIQLHDVGWRLLDEEPTWDDTNNQPFTFITLPILHKIMLYTYGVDEVERINPYAAALCSAHYTRFLGKYEHPHIKTYLQREKLRRERILTAYPTITESDFKRHLALVQLADNLSLFLCLHDPGTEQIHRYFQQGIHADPMIERGTSHKIQAKWVDYETLQLQHLPVVEPFSVTMKQKLISKTQIAEDGLQSSYRNAPFENKTMYFQVVNSST